MTGRPDVQNTDSDMLPDRTLAARTAAIGFALISAAAAAGLVAEAAAQDGLHLADLARAGLIFVTTAWLSWGAAGAMLGLAPRRHPARPLPAARVPQAPTVVLVPICNEDPCRTFARVAAMDASAEAAGVAVDFAILSDTRDETLAAAERDWFAHLLQDRGAQGRMFYRRRTNNIGRKAGNIEDFIRRSGGRWDFAIILDADSLMEGATFRRMIAQMQADPKLGLLQTLPKIVEARSLFGRALQFAASFHSPVFARGLARMQGRTGPFWGHNAIVRIRAFAESCGLPPLEGPAPFGGHILSHDYVEAALLARAGWTVRLDESIEGSFEEGPDNVVSFARRDRRWAQGNLQHMRLLTTHGLRFWSRFVFAQGIMAYLVSPIWGAFLIVSVLATVTAPPPDYFPEAFQLFPVFPSDRTQMIIGLGIGIIGLLVLPKFAILTEAMATRRAAGFGGGFRALRSVLAELLLSSLLAPIMLMFQSRAVFQILAGQDGGWPANQRGEGVLSLADAWRASGWIAVTGALTLAVITRFAPDLLIWLLPVCLPMVAAPALIAWTSRPVTRRLFTVPQELSPAPVIEGYRRTLAAWAAPARNPAGSGAPGDIRNAAA